jgi:cyclic dehypoxanthinyl futalosine synthase
MNKNLNATNDLYNRLLAGNRLNREDYIELYTRSDLLELGCIANELRQQKHPDSSPVTFVIDRNINYTNLCACECKFCVFHKKIGDDTGYVLNYNQLREKIEELTQNNGTQVLLQGGLNPDISLEYYISTIENIKNDFPDVAIHAFSPPEIAFIAENNNLSIKELLLKFKNAGLSSIPGGGAEILTDRVRYALSPKKIDSDSWLNVMAIAHSLNIQSTATMMAGSIETREERIEHLLKIRDLQDRTGGFRAFIPWNFQSNKTDIVPLETFSGYDYLKLIAISRIILDNIQNIQVSWPTQGIKVAQVALNFGANDFGGTMMEENVISSTGLKVHSSVASIVAAINTLNRNAAQRTTDYKILKIIQKSLQ